MVDEQWTLNRHKFEFQDWMEERSLLFPCSRLLCPGCGTKLGSIGIYSCWRQQKSAFFKDYWKISTISHVFVVKSWLTPQMKAHEFHYRRKLQLHNILAFVGIFQVTFPMIMAKMTYERIWIGLKLRFSSLWSRRMKWPLWQFEHNLQISNLC